MQTIQEELNEIFFDDTDILQEMKLMNKNVVKKIRDKLAATIKSKDAKRLGKLLKPIPSMSFDGIKSLLKKRAIKNKQQFEKNYKIANRTIKKVKNKDAKNALALTAATAATIKDISVEQVIEDNQRVFDPKNVIMLLMGILILVRIYLPMSGGGLELTAMGYIFTGIAILMIIKTSYNLIVGQEAKHLFIVI